MMTMNDYEFLQRIKQENEDAKAHRRIVARHRTREERKLRRIALLVVLAAISVVATCVAVSLDNSGDDPTRDLPLQIADPAPVTNGVEILGEFAVVAYCPCQECCGVYALNRPTDENGEPIVYTASGARAEAGVTVAVDPDVIPLGTNVYIDGLGWYVAQDTGNFAGNVVDVYFDDHEAACEFGRQDARVSVVVNNG